MCYVKNATEMYVWFEFDYWLVSEFNTFHLKWINSIIPKNCEKQKKLAIFHRAESEIFGFLSFVGKFMDFSIHFFCVPQIFHGVAGSSA